MIASLVTIRRERDINIHFNNLELQNFLSFKEASYDFSHKGFISIIGINNSPDDAAKSNGAGKSSLFNSIIWCLTGQTTSGLKNVQNIYSEGTTKVELDFNIGKDEYKIIRSKNPSSLEIYINGENKSGKGIRDTEQLLTQYLPQLNSQLLNSVIILGQGLPQRLTNNTPSGRKEILEKLSNSDFMIEDLKERINNRDKFLKNSKREQEDKLLELNTSINNLESLKSDSLEELQKLEEIDFDKLQQDILIIEKEIKERNNSLKEPEEKLNEAKATLESLETKVLNSRLDQEKELQNLDLTDTSPIENELVNLRVEYKSLLDEYNKVKDIKDICPTCGQPLKNVQKPDLSSYVSKLHALKENGLCKKQELEEAQANNEKLEDEVKLKFSKQNKAVLEQISDLKLNIYNYTDIIDTSNAYIANLKEKQLKFSYEIKNIEDNKLKVKEAIEKYTNNINSCKKDIKKVEKELTTIENKCNVISKINTIIKRDFRGYLLINVINYISSRVKEYSQEVFGTSKLNFELNGNNIDITYDGKEYEALSGGEKTKIDIIIQLAIRDMLCTFSGFSSNILVIDEVTDFLDEKSAENIYNLFSTKLNDVETSYIISHRKDFSIPIDATLKIVKDENKISRLV